MIKVLLAIGPSREIGGAQKVFLSTINEFLKKQLDVTVVVPDGPLVDHLKSLNIKMYVVDYSSASSFLAISKVLKNEKVDIVNTYLIKISLLFCLINLFYRRTICCTLLNAIIHEKTSNIQKLIYPLLYFLLSKMCDGIIVNSEQNRDHFIKTAKIHGELIKVIYSGIDMSEFVSAHVQKRENSKFILGIVGRLSVEKGHSCLIEALSLLKGIDYECMIIGDGPLRHELEHLVNSFGLQDKVKFHGHKNTIALLMQQMDVIIVPSVNETFGITIVEAFASKKVVIASNAGGIPELVKDHSTGYLFPVKDCSLLAKVITHVYENQREASQIADNAYKLVMQRFTSEIMANNTISYYEQLAQSL